MMTSFISLLIVTSLYAVFVEGMEYDDTFHTFSHCDLTV
jgi:H+/gluconate symporter-like permease